VSVDKRKAHERNIIRLEQEVKEATAAMNGMKTRATIATSIGFFMLYRNVSSSYTGVVVAQLPFLPFEILSTLTHRGLESENVRDCGFSFIYTLTTMAFKQNVPKLMGFAPPRSAYDATRAAARAAAKAEDM
jgi:calcium load-activated calcium channel